MTEHTKTIEGVWYFSSDFDNTGIVVVDGVSHCLARIADDAGIECARESDYAFDQTLVPEEHPLWGPMRAEYAARTGRQHPKAYRIAITVRAEELPDDEAAAYWLARAVREKERHDAFAAENAADAADAFIAANPGVCDGSAELPAFAEWDRLLGAVSAAPGRTPRVAAWLEDVNASFGRCGHVPLSEFAADGSRVPAQTTLPNGTHLRAAYPGQVLTAEAPLTGRAFLERARANAATYEAARSAPEALEAVRVAVREARAAYEAAPSWPLLIAWCGALHDVRDNCTAEDTETFAREMEAYEVQKSHFGDDRTLVEK